MGPPKRHPPRPSAPSRTNLVPNLLLDSTILLVLLPMVTKKPSTVSDTSKSSTDVLPCLLLLDTLPKKPVSVFQVTSTTPELPSPPSPTDSPPSRPSLLEDLSNFFFSLVSLRLAS